MKRISHVLTVLTVLMLAACCQVKYVEVGPYTVSVIEDNVYHIQDFNSENPAGETFDAEGNKTHFNNCSDMYLIVGETGALLIDLSNNIRWADNAAESLRQLVAERTSGKPLTITFTHNHGDHIGMIAAYSDDPDVHFALPQTDFRTLAEHFPEAQRSMIREGHIFDLGGMTVETIEVPGHTDGSMVFYLNEYNILFSGDAIGSGHGVWIFNEESFYKYVSAVPHLIAWLENPENGVNLKKLRIFGGHYWQRDWLPELKGREMGMKYIYDMQELLFQIERGTAATEPSGLDVRMLDTYFRNESAIVVWNAAQAEEYRSQYVEPVVYRDEDVVFRQIDEHTWAGNGHFVYNESVYIVEGEERAMVIDAGTRMPNLDKAVAAITDKPVMMVLTHAHGDHVGGVFCFPEVWMHEAELALIGNDHGYEGKISFLKDGDIIDLGRREIEVLHTPGHTAGSITFFDKEKKYGFSGDAFGSTNLLLYGGTFSTLIETTARTAEYMQKHGIEKLYPGHYNNGNVETLQRVLDEKKMSEEVLAGKRKGTSERSTGGLNSYIYDFGVHIRYNDPEALK